MPKSEIADHMVVLFLGFFKLIGVIIAFQYCVSFCHTSTWITHGHTYVPSLEPLSSFHPFRWSIPPSIVTEHQIWAPCIINGISPSHKKDHIWVCSNEGDEPILFFKESLYCSPKWQYQFISLTSVGGVPFSTPFTALKKVKERYKSNAWKKSIFHAFKETFNYFLKLKLTTKSLIFLRC